MYRGAVRSILSELARQSRLVVLPPLTLEAPKTARLAAKLRELDLDDALILVEDFDENLFLAARNLPRIEVMLAREADPVSLIAFEHVVATEGALRKLEERLT
jgi:large subunit ribosomal protein L4